MALPCIGVVLSLFIFCFVHVSLAEEFDEEFDVLATLVLEHSFDGGFNPAFSKRGTLTIQSLKSGVAQFNEDHRLTANEKDSLQRLVDNDDLYYVRIASKGLGSPTGPTHYVSAFTKACSLYESRLSDRLTLHVDQSGSLLGLSINALTPICHGVTVDRDHLSSFNSTVEVYQTVNGPAPETQTYIQKMEQEKAEKEKGEQVDNRSFIAKYWMYLVPLFLFLMFSSSVDPNAQGGGNRE